MYSLFYNSSISRKTNKTWFLALHIPSCAIPSCALMSPASSHQNVLLFVYLHPLTRGLHMV